MAKQSAIDRAINNLDSQIEVLRLAKQHLMDQIQPKKSAKATKPRTVPPVARETA